MTAPLRLLVVSDANLDNLTGLLTQDASAPAVAAVSAPFGQVLPTLADPQAPVWADGPDVCLVWTHPEAVLPGFAARCRGESVADQVIADQVDAYVQLLLSAATRVRLLLVGTWALPTWQRGYGALDQRPGLGLGYGLLQANLQLCQGLAGEPRALVLDVRRWIETVGAAAWSPKLWFLGRIPYHREVFLAAVADIKAALRGLQGQARKIVIVDLDNTLWGGILGEVGWAGLRVGGHDPVGEAHLALQVALKALSRRGVLLAIASRNDEAAALEALRLHPGMALRPDDFAGWRIDWGDKAAHIADLLAELNLGPEAAVFVDDTPAERDRVRQALPAVLVPEWPVDPSAAVPVLLGLRCFDVTTHSREDTGRTRAYVAERQRRQLRCQVPSLEQWLASLELVVAPEPLGLDQAPRAAQLLNRTNQMTLTGQRATETELLAWAATPGTEVWTYQVRDRFGDAGLTGLACLEQVGGDVWLRQLALSCRVMGRGVEAAMLHHLSQRTAHLGARALWARPGSTSRNQPCRELLAGLFEAAPNPGILVWRVPPLLDLPAHVRLA